MKILSLTIPGFEKIDSNLPTGVPSGGLGNGTSLGTGQKIIQALIELTLVLAVLFALYLIIQGGVDIIQSEGKKEKLNNGRQKILYALLGLSLLFLSFLMVNAVSAFLGKDINLLCIVFQPFSACK